MATSEHDAVTELLDPLLVRARGRIGTILREKWRLDVLVGVGGMAAVYAATHRNGSRCAVKILHTELSTNAVLRQRFLREGYTANKIEHSGVVRISDDDIAADGSAFFIMELLDGETTEERRIRLGGRLAEDDVLSIADQVLDVLGAAHAKGIVHRDLKPENLFLTRDGHVKVLDFGIARLRELSTASTATRTGSAMGTPQFMPPEQARGLWDEVDGRSDLWAVGATMFTLLAGRCVHEGRSIQEVHLSAMTNAAPSMISMVPAISPAVGAVVDRALVREKEKRWSSAGRMQQAVRDAYYDRNKTPISTAPRLTVPPEVPNRTLAMPGAPNSVPARLPTTNGAVARSASPASAPLPLAALVLGGGFFVGVMALGIALVVVTTHRTSSSAKSAATVSRPPPQTGATTSSKPTATQTPVIAATDLPPVTATPKPTAKPTSTSAAPGATASCNPPFVIDPATQKKTWKVECL